MPGSTSSHTAPSPIGELPVLLDVSVGREHERLGGLAVGQVADVLRADGMQPGQPVRPGNHQHRPVAAIDHPGRRSPAAAARASGRRSAKGRRRPRRPPRRRRANSRRSSSAHRGMIMSGGSLGSARRRGDAILAPAEDGEVGAVEDESLLARQAQRPGRRSSPAERRPRVPQAWQTTWTCSSSAGRNDGAPWPRWVWRTSPISSSSSRVR